MTFNADEENEGADTGSSVAVASGVAEQLRADLRKAHPFPDGTVVRWQNVTNEGTRLHYAAIYAAGRWWVTGSGNIMPKNATHSEFIALISSAGHRITGFEVANAFERIEL